MKNYTIRVEADPYYMEDKSEPDEQRYVFGYKVVIVNEGDAPARLVSRHWFITDAHNRVEEVRGMGVVGEHPRLAPGERYEYNSWTQISTPFGSMRGSYQMLADDGTRFEADIPEFQLIAPRILH
ncbi:Co2+/Mg2+ efflux protein ApaG [Gulbenkiania mobilis]|uniref:Protein ApaG n=1 Tax=Gulbenkiania mobilis TaxID=397457 RepID=A0ABY2D0H6_GULMO|nr:Co2+/Mg2+ efflux protein ApaG [Gulbenkiania mobilis]TCW30791.1 ApaG protein [Gulbenkiania mobilis]